MNQERCKSQFCIVGDDGIRGRLLSPPSATNGLAKIWCSNCLSIGKQITFFSTQTAEMIRNIYKSYNDTNLPQEVKLILRQFTYEIIQELGEEL